MWPNTLWLGRSETFDTLYYQYVPTPHQSSYNSPCGHSTLPLLLAALGLSLSIALVRLGPRPGQEGRHIKVAYGVGFLARRGAHDGVHGVLLLVLLPLGAHLGVHCVLLAAILPLQE